MSKGDNEKWHTPGVEDKCYNTNIQTEMRPSDVRQLSGHQTPQSLPQTLGTSDRSTTKVDWM